MTHPSGPSSPRPKPTPPQPNPKPPKAEQPGPSPAPMPKPKPSPVPTGPPKDWSLTITPSADEARPDLYGFRVTCSCGYRSRLQTGADAFHNVTVAAMQHLRHGHNPTAGDLRLESVGLEVAKTKAAGWGWHCHVCDEAELHLLTEAAAQANAAEHGRQYRHHRRVAATSSAPDFPRARIHPPSPVGG